MRAPIGRQLFATTIGATAALVAFAFGAAALARGGYHHAQAQAMTSPACGFVNGTLADPAETQRCLAERYKPPKPKPGAPPPAPANAAVRGGTGS